jgi:hypothetical protein
LPESLIWVKKRLRQHQYYRPHRKLESDNPLELDMTDRFDSTMPSVLMPMDRPEPIPPQETSFILKVGLAGVILLLLILWLKH